MEENISKGGDANLILPYILTSVKQLEKAGADSIILPCNTLHVLAPAIKNATHLPFFDLVETAREAIKKYRCVAVLCTTKTKETKLYGDVLYPENQEEVEEVILRILRGTATAKDKRLLEDTVDLLIKRGAEVVLLACTDIANLLGQYPHTLDTTQLLIDNI